MLNSGQFFKLFHKFVNATSGITGGGQGGRLTPLTFFTGKVLLTNREKRSKGKMENEGEKKEEGKL